MNKKEKLKTVNALDKERGWRIDEIAEWKLCYTAEIPKVYKLRRRFQTEAVMMGSIHVQDNKNFIFFILTIYA